MTDSITEETQFTVHCQFCGEDVAIVFHHPKGWAAIEIENQEFDGLCPKHAGITDFIDNQCPGCVSSWGNECPLFQSFAFPNRNYPRLNQEDFTKLEQGYCPRRVNGTTGFDMSRGQIETINLSDPAPEGGKALAAAIKEYLEKYGE